MTYKIGDPDPTPPVGAEQCQEETFNWACTWNENDHPDQHVSGNGTLIMDVWPVENPQQITRHSAVIPPDYFELTITEE